MIAKVLLSVLCFASSADAASLAKTPKNDARKALMLRGGGVDKKTALLVNAAGLAAFGSEFGSALVGSKWASVRYWDNKDPDDAWQQVSEAFGIGLLLLSYTSYDAAVSGDEAAQDKLGKVLSFGWIGWSLMHLKWWKMGAPWRCPTEP